MHRRVLIRWLLSGAAAWPLRGLHLHAQAAALPDRNLATLRALAPAVLPSELGTAGHDKVIGDFVQWLAAYRSGAERSWGYGHPRKTGTVAIDTTVYRAQLIDIEALARRRGGGPLASLSLADRRALITDLIGGLDVRGLSGAPNGRHIVIDVMSFFYSSSAATDLCYRARIGSTSCRGLAGAASRPASLAAG